MQAILNQARTITDREKRIELYKKAAGNLSQRCAVGSNRALQAGGYYQQEGKESKTASDSVAVFQAGLAGVIGIVTLSLATHANSQSANYTHRGNVYSMLLETASFVGSNE